MALSFYHLVQSGRVVGFLEDRFILCSLQFLRIVQLLVAVLFAHKWLVGEAALITY